MSMLKTAALAAAVLGGSLASAEAQPYGHWGQGHGHGYGHGGYHRAQPPVYVHPRLARKQAQLSERFVEKYGYVQPRHYGHPSHPWGHGYGHRPRPPVAYHHGW